MKILSDLFVFIFLSHYKIYENYYYFILFIFNTNPIYKVEVIRNGKVVHTYEKVTDLVQGQSCIKSLDTKTNGIRQICEGVKITKL